ncbi:MAG TPA: hypothetical protein ENH23_02280 [candidate division Zixibacteria bacterium]|nr:hypothetical protein [candidate division Zixibacteria bacterium]
MKDQKEISVIYKHYIPEDWIEELETAIKTTDVPFKKSKDEDKYYNFTGPELADIIIFIKDNPESIFLAPALYDIVKVSIVGLWKKLTSLNVKKMQSGETEAKQKKISVRYEDAQQRRVTINIEGDLDNDIIEEIVEEALEVIKTDKKEEFFQQPDFVDNSQGVKAMELKFNPETKVWEPENFGDIRRKMDDYQKWAEENFDS